MSHRELHVSAHFVLSDFVECGETQQRENTPNLPAIPESIAAIEQTAKLILDPVVEQFGSIELTYGLATRALLAHIEKRIAPRYDQHAAHELNKGGRRLCNRDGFAVDLRSANTSSLLIAQFIVERLPFDRLYYYGSDRPVHVSYGPEHTKQVCVMRFNSEHDRWFPQRTLIENFLALNE